MIKWIWILGIALALAGCQNPPATPTAPAALNVSRPCKMRGALPDPKCTPGVTNPDVTSGTLATTICLSGWTATIRPEVTYTNHLKAQQIDEYGFKDKTPADYEEDHLISLQLGGSPTDPRNLWPQPRYGSPNAVSKDKVENYLKAQVCAGKMSLEEAQKGIAADWTQYASAVAMSIEAISSEDPDDNIE